MNKYFSFIALLLLSSCTIVRGYLSVSYKADRWEISLIGSNIVGTSQYERVRVSSMVQSYTLTHLRPMEVLLKVCWDL